MSEIFRGVIHIWMILLTVGFAWALLEILFYGEVHPRLTDDCVAIVLASSIYLNIKNRKGA